MANVNKTTLVGSPFFGILALIFITLKLCSVITWSWWWVLAPLWAPFIVGLAVVMITLILLGVAKKLL